MSGRLFLVFFFYLLRFAFGLVCVNCSCLLVVFPVFHCLNLFFFEVRLFFLRVVDVLDVCCLLFFLKGEWQFVPLLGCHDFFSFFLFSVLSLIFRFSCCQLELQTQASVTIGLLLSRHRKDHSIQHAKKVICVV